MAKSIKVSIVFGLPDLVGCFKSGKVSKAALDGFKQFKFATKAEVDAFLVGVEAGSQKLDYCFPSKKEARKLRRKQWLDNFTLE